MKAPAKVRDAVAPAWLIEAVRPRPAPAPVGLMVRAALAICVPLAVGFAAHQPALGLLPAMGGLLASVVDIGGPYPARARRVVSATVAGGAAGLVLGGLIHGRGWVTIAVLIAVAGVSVLFSAAGGTASVTGLQLLVYTSFGTGPLGALKPWWHAPLLLLAGAGWAMLLIVPGWLLFPRAAEQRSVAAVYRALAGELRAAGTPEFADGRLAVTGALNAPTISCWPCGPPPAVRTGADHGVPPPAPEQVRELIARLESVADAERSGIRPPEPASPGPGEHLSPVAEAVRRVQAALA